MRDIEYLEQGLMICSPVFMLELWYSEKLGSFKMSLYCIDMKNIFNDRNHHFFNFLSELMGQFGEKSGLKYL